jgi:hypothetical protein
VTRFDNGLWADILQDGVKINNKNINRPSNKSNFLRGKHRHNNNAPHFSVLCPLPKAVILAVI